MADDARCLNCAMLGLIEERFPDGIDDAGAQEVTDFLVYLSGVVLASCDAWTLIRFIRAVIAARSAEMAEAAGMSGQAH